MQSNKSVSLVLGSGGARGMAHIGVIEVLEERGYQIDEISGCSAGALVGGIYAAGQLPEFKEWICNLGRVDVFGLMDFSFSSRGFIKGEKVFQVLKGIVEERQIEELAIPFSCNAVDYHHGRERVFDRGSLFSAIRASVSIPTLVQPALIDGVEYIDGGVLNPLPLDLIKKSKKNLVVAVNLNALSQSYIAPPKKDHGGKRLIKTPAWLKEYQLKMRRYFDSQPPATQTKGLGSLDLLNRSLELLHDRVSNLMLEKYPVAILIEISKKQASTMEFYRSAELIEIGRIKMTEALDQLEHES
ncbi:patatin-like phospholipase family protein [Algoriphagus namhaensis]